MTGKKRNLAYISNDSERKRKLNLRKRGFMKKLEEIKILCDVDACAVIYSPFNPTPEVWPSNSEVHRVIEKFENLPEEKQTQRSVNHEEYLTQKITKVKNQVQRLTEGNNDKLMEELMFRCLNGDMGDLAIDDSNRGDLCEFIDGHLRKLYFHRKLALENPHPETGESSSMAMAMDMPPIAMAEAGFFNSPQLTNEPQPLVTSNQHISSHGGQFLNVPAFNFPRPTNEVHGLEQVQSLGNNFMNAPISNPPQLTNEIEQPIIFSDQGANHVDSLASNPLPFSNPGVNTQVMNQGANHVDSLASNSLPFSSPGVNTQVINQGANHVDSLASNPLPFSNPGVNTQVMNQDEVYYPLNQQDWYAEEMMKYSDQTYFPWMEENNHYNHHQL